VLFVQQKEIGRFVCALEGEWGVLSAKEKYWAICV
jgi:hypothetical protein